MSFPVKKFIIFMMALGVFFGTAYLTFKCGYSQGLKDAPRHFYSVDVARAIRENRDFKRYVDSLYVSTYISVIDSVIRTDKVVGLVSGWLDAHPDCAIGKRLPTKNVKASDFDNVFFKRQN